MTRPLRIQYPDAWYHVMNRGRHGESIYDNAKKIKGVRSAVDCRGKTNSKIPQANLDFFWFPWIILFAVIRFLQVGIQ